LNQQAQNESLPRCRRKPPGGKIIDHGAFALTPKCATHLLPEPTKSAT
jgi:hypothetical protein